MNYIVIIYLSNHILYSQISSILSLIKNTKPYTKIQKYTNRHNHSPPPHPSLLYTIKPHYNFAFGSAYDFQSTTSLHHETRWKVFDDCWSDASRCLYIFPSLMPSGEFITKSVGATVSTRATASSLSSGSSFKTPCL